MIDSHGYDKGQACSENIFHQYGFLCLHDIKYKDNNNSLVQNIERIHSLVQVIKHPKLFVEVSFSITYSSKHPEPSSHGKQGQEGVCSPVAMPVANGIPWLELVPAHIIDGYK